MIKKKVAIIVGLVLLSGGVFTVVNAEHTWGNYHWGRTANPFTLELGDNVSSTWDTHLRKAATDWSVSSVLDTVVSKGKSKRNCRGTNGRVEVCSAGYGFNGWLGIAQIWISGDHITKGVVKVNDSYFNLSAYDTPAWRNLVMCQEIGHTLGLAHQDEDFDNANLDTCMDYSSDPVPNQHPNQHDYDMLEYIYEEHTDEVDTVIASDDGDGGGNGNGKGNGKGKKGKPAGIGQDIDLNNPSAWGQAVKQDAQGNNSLYERDLGNGNKLFTFVIWVE